MIATYAPIAYKPVELRPAALVLIGCPRCAFMASARSEGRAITGIVAHLVKVHCEPVLIRMKESA